MVAVVDGPKFIKGRPVYYWFQPRRGDPIPVFRGSPKVRHSKRAGSMTYPYSSKRQRDRQKRQQTMIELNQWERELSAGGFSAP